MTLFPPFKGTSALTTPRKESQRETAKSEADAKRLATLKRKNEEFQQGKSQVAASLKDVSGNKSGHIRFDDDLPNCSQADEVAVEESNDRRFQVDDRFIDEVADDDMEVETERNRQILSKVLAQTEETTKSTAPPMPNAFEVDTDFVRELRKKAEENVAEAKPFSLLAAFGREADPTPSDNLAPQRPKFISKPFEGHSDRTPVDDEYPTANDQSPVKKPPVPAKFFFTPNDPRIRHAVKLFRRTQDLDTVRSKWAKFRPALVMNSKKNAKSALRQKKQKANLRRKK